MSKPPIAKTDHNVNHKVHMSCRFRKYARGYIFPNTARLK